MHIFFEMGKKLKIQLRLLDMIRHVKQRRLILALSLIIGLLSGTAAILAGLDRVSFLLKLHEFGIPVIDLDVEEVMQDAENA